MPRPLNIIPDTEKELIFRQAFMGRNRHLIADAFNVKLKTIRSIVNAKVRGHGRNGLDWVQCVNCGLENTATKDIFCSADCESAWNNSQETEYLEKCLFSN